jgi:hypothetical protein
MRERRAPKSHFPSQSRAVSVSARTNIRRCSPSAEIQSAADARAQPPDVQALRGGYELPMATWECLGA